MTVSLFTAIRGTEAAMSPKKKAYASISVCVKLSGKRTWCGRNSGESRSAATEEVILSGKRTEGMMQSGCMSALFFLLCDVPSPG